MYIEIDQQSGFCFGVVNAISKAENAIADGRHVFSLGDIVHNHMEVRRLESLGLLSIRHENLSSLQNATLLIRAHGEPPSTYEIAKKNSIKIIDATCPVVARLQKMVVRAYEQMRPINGQVVILGKRGHAEVVGLTGQIAEQAIVIEGMDDVDSIDFNRPIYLLSQTTQSLSLFGEIKKALLARAMDANMVTVNDTICRRVSNRESHLRDFARRFDVIIFVSGKKSSNGKVLFDVCKSANPHSYNIEDELDIRLEWFEGCNSVGICGATSTPKWLMNQVAEFLEKMTSQS